MQRVTSDVWSIPFVKGGQEGFWRNLVLVKHPLQFAEIFGLRQAEHQQNACFVRH